MKKPKKPKAKRRRWTDDEVKLLREKYGSCPVAEIAKEIDRPAGEVRNQAWYLGLTKPAAAIEAEAEAKRSLRYLGFHLAPAEYAAMAELARKAGSSIREWCECTILDELKKSHESS